VGAILTVIGVDNDIISSALRVGIALIVFALVYLLGGRKLIIKLLKSETTIK